MTPVFLLPLLAPSVDPPSALALFERRVVVGTESGGIYGLDPANGGEAWRFPGLGDGRTLHVAAREGRYYWTTAGSSRLHWVERGQVRPIEVGFKGPIRRMERWDDWLVLQGDGEAGLYHLRTGRAHDVKRVFPPALGESLRRAEAAIHWEGATGIVVAKTAEGVETWRWRGGEGFRLLGARKGVRLEGLGLSPHGMAHLAGQRAMVLGFGTDALTASERPLRGEVKEVRDVRIVGDRVWWASGHQVACLSVDSGQTDVYHSRRGPIRALAGNESAMWVATAQGVGAIRPDDELSLEALGMVRVTFGGAAERTGLAKRVEDGLRDAALLKRAAKKPGEQGLRAVFSASRIPLTRTLPKRMTGTPRYGDFVYRGKAAGIYLGDGIVGELWKGKLHVERLDPAGAWTFARTLPDEREVTLRGAMESVATRNGALRWVSGSPYDRPYLPQHRTMEDEIESWLGTPYRWGGNTRDGVDCSGFVHLVFASAGVRIPRQSQLIGRYSKGRFVSDELRWGDVVVVPGHVLIYTGEGTTAESLGGTGVTHGRIAWYPAGTVRRFLE